MDLKWHHAGATIMMNGKPLVKYYNIDFLYSCHPEVEFTTHHKVLALWICTEPGQGKNPGPIVWGKYILLLGK